jgi:peptidoglycan/xylan/chitin deacetylase (PgdA/CDA1 family)
MRRFLTIALAAAAVAAAGIVNASPSQAAICGGYVGLTFDDGPTGTNTTTLLAALKKSGLRATMFNEGRYAAAYPALVQAEVNAGMWIGDHSYTHPHLTQLTKTQIDSEISRTQQAIANAGGGTPKLFRPPFGTSNSAVRSVEATYGLREIIWDITTGDWSGVSVDRIVQANAKLTNGQIILMHDGPANTITAIPRIAQVLASHGLCAGMISPQTGRAVAPN